MTLTAFLLSTALTLSGAQDADGASLDRLYERLATAETAQAAASVEDQIRLVWTDSGSDTVNLLLDRAETAITQGDTPRAERHLQDALALEPEFAEAWRRMAELRLIRSETGAALEAINQALIADPRHFRALTMLGSIMERLDRPRAAFEAYEEALRVHPHYEDAKRGRDRLAPRVEGRSL